MESGEAHHLPVGYLRMNDTLLTVSYKRRTWWRNLRSGGLVTIRLKGKEVFGTVEVVEDDLGVADELAAIIMGNPQAARMMRVKLDAKGQPEPESLKQAVKERVIVRTTLS
jgi:hypothetical protein